MTILAGDIKFVKTQVMDDVPEGGGAPTSNLIVDGVSNAIMPDVSETDRAGGRVNLRKVAVAVDTSNVDSYLGANLIIAEPPSDPNISVTLFNSGDFFDKRDAAKSRIEAYLSVGTQYAGYLYGNHIAGQDSLLIYQKTGDLPPIGGTLVLTKREGFSDQVVQYVRIIEAKSVLRTFEDDKGTYQRYVLTLRLANILNVDFPGFDMSRFEYTKTQVALATKLSDTVVANAARYYGVVPLQVAGSIGEFTIKASSIFSQLVPSAQIETPIADARTNQLSAGVISSGSTITQTLTAVFNPANNMFTGGGIGIGTLSIVNGAISVTDSGGRLMSGGSQVGTVDYENGVLSLNVDVFGGSSLPYTVTYAPASAPQAVNQSQGFEVKQETRSQNYVRTIQPSPVPGTLAVSYMSQGRWYVLREQGDGSIRGADSSYGAGSLNAGTGTVSVTLGALPDVGSSVIYTWVQPDAARASDVLTLENSGKFYWLINTSGDSTTTPGAKAIARGGLTITWNDGTVRTVTDDSNGALTGYGSGTVDYGKGVIKLSPTVLPAPGTPVTVTLGSSRVAQPLTDGVHLPTLALVSGAVSGNLGVSGITPGSVSFVVDRAQLRFQYDLGPISDWGAQRAMNVRDNGTGGLLLSFSPNTPELACGTINYATGAISLTPNILIPQTTARIITAWDNIFLRVANPPGMAIPTA